jgi:hypothetical protein
VLKLVTVTEVVELFEIIALGDGESDDLLVAETEEDKLSNDVVVTDDEADDVLVILTKAEEVDDDDRDAVAEILSIKPEEVTDWVDDWHDDSLILNTLVDVDVCIEEVEGDIEAELVCVDKGEVLWLTEAEKVPTEVIDSLLDTVNNADGDIDIDVPDVDDALLDDVAELKFVADTVEATVREDWIESVLDGDGVKVDSIEGEEVCVAEFESEACAEDEDETDIDDVMDETDDSVDWAERDTWSVDVAAFVGSPDCERSPEGDCDGEVVPVILSVELEDVDGEEVGVIERIAETLKTGDFE